MPCPHFYQAVSGVQRGSHTRLGNSWWDRGERVGRSWGNIWTSTVSDQMPYNRVNSPFFSLLIYCLVETVCADTVPGHESCMSDGGCHIQKDKRDLFHFNHVWLIIAAAADVWESAHYRHKNERKKKEKLIFISSKCSYLTNCWRKSVPKSSAKNQNATASLSVIKTACLQGQFYISSKRVPL